MCKETWLLCEEEVEETTPELWESELGLQEMRSMQAEAKSLEWKVIFKGINIYGRKGEEAGLSSRSSRALGNLERKLGERIALQTVSDED